ncbi:F0F1 ATP synthase subunit B [Phototrophicus methaneseepsis]|uniref:ATP synthase subunit b n=1 Tax=Phototrophicus methaneseepsis TaxID=2710758 RepID=A0A7S8IEJ9_9CHLR|nr:F0F1 ATP synthase subunit B [Phototrophicus methaneseepsis]QPC81898.1 F0F1 ATP synthase subunit B [Phototrophicus methaneseepsis]
MSKKIMKQLIPASAMLVAILAVFPAVALAQEEHAAAAESPLTPLGINAGLLFTHTFNFILIAVILGVVLWRPLVNFLDSRSAKIQKGLEDAAAAARARQNAEAEAEKILAAARAESAKLLEEARGRGDEVANSIRLAAEQEAEGIKVNAHQEGVAARDAELAGLREQVLNISSAVAGRILGESIDPQKQQALVSNFFSTVPADAKNVAGSVEVVSAMPLTDAEKSKIAGELSTEDITYVVDPAILGGLIVRAPGRVIDGSVRSNLNALSARLN